MKKLLLLPLLLSPALSGCRWVPWSSAPLPKVHAGSKLYNKSGQFRGTVMTNSEMHTFPNGVTEPGVQIYSGLKAGNLPAPAQWLPTRAAETFVIR
jgi:hypothetical protein